MSVVEDLHYWTKSFVTRPVETIYTLLLAVAVMVYLGIYYKDTG